MYLFIDTETTGLPQNWQAPSSDTDNWPRLVTASWIVCNQDRSRILPRDFIVRPDGFRIPEAASKVHGISQSLAAFNGRALEDVLGILLLDLSRGVRHVVAHNMSFDRSIIECEFHRMGSQSMPFNERRTHCTMEMGTDVCKIPSSRGYKWPKLPELHHNLFGQGFDGEHSSMADVAACMRCFFALVDLKRESSDGKA